MSPQARVSALTRKIPSLPWRIRPPGHGTIPLPIAPGISGTITAPGIMDPGVIIPGTSAPGYMTPGTVMIPGTMIPGITTGTVTPGTGITTLGIIVLGMILPMAFTAIICTIRIIMAMATIPAIITTGAPSAIIGSLPAVPSWDTGTPV